MKKIIFLTITYCCLVSFSYLKAQAQEEKQYMHDFGFVETGATVGYTFNMTEIFGKEIKIAKVETHCDCLTTEWKKDEIHLSFYTGDKQGVFIKSLTVYLQDSEKMLTLYIKGIIKPTQKEQALTVQRRELSKDNSFAQKMFQQQAHQNLLMER